MKVAILAGGLGTRLREETEVKPKPMVEIGSIPILVHILKLYSHWNFNDFIICIGYKGSMIKDFFLNYYYRLNDFTMFMGINFPYLHEPMKYESWNVFLCDTGKLTETGGRIKRIQKHLGKETFMMTYGDGLSDVNINEIVKFHREKKKYATMLAVNSPSRFGALVVDENGLVTNFQEKCTKEGIYINGGFFVLEPQVFDYIEGDKTSWELDVLPKLIKDEQLVAYKYDGFWRCMDSIKDRDELNKMWNENKAPWKIW